MKENIQRAIDWYRKISEPTLCINTAQVDKAIERFETDNPIELLQPGEIDEVLNQLIQASEYWDIRQELCGLYISRLIQKSYELGFNEFALNTGKTQILCMGYGLEGSKDRPLELRINGGVGVRSFSFSRNADLTLETGPMESACFSYLVNCKVTVTTDTQSFFAKNSVSSVYEICSDISNGHFGLAQDCEFNIYGMIDWDSFRTNFKLEKDPLFESDWKYQEQCHIIPEDLDPGKKEHLEGLEFALAYATNGMYGRNDSLFIHLIHDNSPKPVGCTYRVTDLTTYRDFKKHLPFELGNSVELINKKLN